MKRPTWLLAGVVVGVGGTLWAEQRVRRGVRRAVDRFAPEQVATGARRSVRRAGDRVRDAVEVGRETRADRERELWDELDTRTTGPTQARPTPRHARTPARGRVEGRR